MLSTEGIFWMQLSYFLWFSFVTRLCKGKCPKFMKMEDRTYFVKMFVIWWQCSLHLDTIQCGRVFKCSVKSVYTVSCLDKTKQRINSALHRLQRTVQQFNSETATGTYTPREQPPPLQWIHLLARNLPSLDKGYQPKRPFSTGRTYTRGQIPIGAYESCHWRRTRKWHHWKY
jgi:hypothetical protein